MNVLTSLPMSQMDLRECGSLLLRPMMELGLGFVDQAGVQHKLYELSGGAPNRIQMYCRAIIEILADARRSLVTVEDCVNAPTVDWVQTETVNWYRESTTELEKIVAGVAAFRLPCKDFELVAFVEHFLPSLSSQSIHMEVLDLTIADILTRRADKRLAFSFPGLIELVRPHDDLRESVSFLRQQLRRWLQTQKLEHI